MNAMKDQGLSFSAVYRTVAYTIAVIVILVSVMVLAGWYTNQPVLVQVVPTFAPMQYNTAICFLVSAIGMAGLFRFPKLAVIFGLIVFIISIITLFQYLANTNLGIDELAVKAHITTKTSHPGRMAPNTAVCFILSGLVTLFFGYFRQNKVVLIAGFIITLCIGVLSFVALFGYISGLSTAYGWGNLTRMAVHTSVSFILLTVAYLCIYLSFNITQLNKTSPFYPGSIFLVGLFLSYLFWQALYSSQHQGIQRVIDQESKFIVHVIQRSLGQQTQAIDRLFARAESNGYRTAADLNSDIDYYFKHMQSLVVIEVASKKLKTPVFRTQTGVSTAAGRIIYLRCQESFKKNPDMMINAVNNHLCVRNVAKNDLAIVSLPDVMKPLLKEENIKNFSIQIFQDNNVIYKSNRKQAVNQVGDEEVSIKPIVLDNLKWKLQVKPNESFFIESKTVFPNMILGFCLLVTFSFSYVILLWQRSLQQAASLAQLVAKQKILKKNLSSIIETSKEAVIIANRDKEILFCNQEAAHLWKVRSSDMVGKSIDIYFNVSKYLGEDIFTQEIASYAGKKYKVTIELSNRPGVPVELTLNNMEYDSQSCIMFSIYDVSERAFYEKEITKQAQTIQLIYDITSSIADIKDLDKSFQICLDKMCESLKWPIGHVYIKSTESDTLQSSDIWYLNDPESLDPFKNAINTQDQRKGQGLAGSVWALQKSRWIENIYRNEEFIFPNIYKEYHITSAVLFPVSLDHEVVAVFELFSYNERPVDAKLLQMFDVLSQQIGRMLERRHVQDELEISELKNRLILDAAGEGIYGLDLEGNTTFVNNATKRLLGYAEDELLDTKIHDVIHYAYPDGRPFPEESCPIYATFTSGEECRVNKDIFWKKNGDPIYVEYVGTPMYDDEHKMVGSVVVFNDISERLLLEEEKREQEEFFTNAFNSVDDYAIVSLDMNGKVVSWNKGAEKIKGYKKKDVIGKHFSMFYPDDTKDTLPQKLLDEAKEQGRVQNYGWRVRSNGELFWADTLINALYDKEHKIRGFIKITRDLTERKQAEEDLKKYSDDLERSNKELDNFAYIASHDLKEPLRGISNMSSFLLEDYSDKLDDTGKDYLQRLAKLCGRLEEFIDALLKYSRVGRLDMAFRSVNINDLLKEDLDLIDQFIKDHNAEIIIEGQMPTIIGDQVRIGEVFLNLITNGIKYNDSDRKVIKISSVEDEDKYTFTIADNGIGIAEKNYDKIFKIFCRLHRKDKYGGGTGAGMTIVKKIIEKHHGIIWVESEEGKGSRFCFTISKNLINTANKESSHE